MRAQCLIRRIASPVLCLCLLAICCRSPVVQAQEPPEFTKAVERYRARVRKDPTNLALHREMIEQAQQTDRLAVPLHIYKAAYEKQTTHTVILYSLAYTYLMDGSQSALIEADKLLQAAIKKKPEFADAYAALGKCYAAQGKTEPAVEAFQISVQLNPSLWEVHFELGDYYRDQQNYQQAIAHYTKILSRYPKSAVTHFNLGVVYRQIGNLEAAHQAFSQTIKHDKTRADAHYQLGQIHALQGKLDEALKQYRKGRELDSNNSKVRYQLAHIFLDRDNGRHAILAVRSALAAEVEYAEYADLLKDVGTLRAAEIIAQILEEHPDNADLQHFVGRLFLGIDQPENARNHLERAKALDPNDAAVRFDLGQLYESEASDAAIEEYEQAAALGNTDINLLLKLAESYRQKKNVLKLQQTAQQILAIDQNQPEIHYQLSNLYDEQSHQKKQAGEEQEAKALFKLATEHADKATKLAPNATEYLLKLATLYDRAKQFKAIRIYDQVIERDPQNAEAYYRRGAFMSNFTFGREQVLLYAPEDVMGDLQRAVQLDPKLAGAHYALGVAYDRMGNVEKAMAEFQKAAELAPGDPRPHLYLGEKYANAGKPHTAISAFAKAIQADPENVEALKDYAYLCLAYDEEGGGEEAKHALEMAIKIRPNDPEILMNYGHTLLLSRKNHEAIDHYLRSIELRPDWALSHYNLAIAYEAIGKTALALAEYQKVIELDAQSPHSEKALERIRFLKGEE